MQMLLTVVRQIGTRWSNKSLINEPAKSVRAFTTDCNVTNVGSNVGK